MICKKFLLKQKYNGLPNLDDFQLIEKKLRPLQDKEFLVEAEYISVDPYMRLLITDIGKTVLGEQVGKIIESKNDKFPVGKYVLGEFGWRTYTIANEQFRFFSPAPPRLLPDYYETHHLPKSLALGALGMTGYTAQFALLDVCKPKENETVVITSAGGAVGSHAGQLAKIEGCRVVGISGSDVKGQWLLDELGFDAHVNYKQENWIEKLNELTPNGVDCFLDNVGGDISNAILARMNKSGRVVVVGTISTYNNEGQAEKGVGASSEVSGNLKPDHVTMKGFSVFKYWRQWPEANEITFKWITEGKLKYRETITEGFENLPQAFIGMLRGDNIGKAIVSI